MTIIDVVGDNVITVDVHSLCRLRGQVDRRATGSRISGFSADRDYRGGTSDQHPALVQDN